jgi:hypothetical protein
MDDQNDADTRQVLDQLVNQVVEQDNTDQEGSEFVSEEVKKNISQLEGLSTSVGKSLEELKTQIETLNSVFDGEQSLDPQSTVVKVDEETKGDGESFGGEYTIGGGTFAVDGGVHKMLKGDLESFSSKFGNGSDFEGAGYGHSNSTESKILRKIGRAGSNMSSGLKKVEDSVSTRINNIHSLKNVMNTSISKLVDIIKSSDNNGVAETNARIIKSVHDKLNSEFDNQIKVLQDVLKVKVKPTSDDLMALIKDNNNFQALAERLGVGYNTQEASDRLALAYTNLSKLQILSKQVESALKTLEISLDKYKSLKSLEELKKVLSESLKNTSGKSTESLSKVLSAINTLKNAHSSHGKVVKELTGAMEFMGGDFTTGVGRVKNSKVKSTLKTRVKTYEQTVKELFKNFINQISLSFRDIKVSAEAISDKLGNDIVYDDDVKLFISIFEGFNNDLNNGKLFYSLISLDQSMSGRELKTRFMDNLNKLIESLVVLQKYNYLSDVKKQLESVKENIETYSDTVLNIRSNEDTVKTGNAEFLWSDNLVDPSIPASVSNTIKETITKLKFYGNLSMLKDNLSRVSKEYPSLQEDYDKLLGKSIGNKLSELQKDYTESVDRLNDNERGRGFLLKTYNEDPMRTEDEKIPKGLVETLYKLQYEAKVGLYKTVEAVDLYLLKFTEKVSNDITALKELDDMIKQTDLISAWYDNTSIANIDNLYALIQPDADKLLAFEVYDKLNMGSLNEISSFTTGKRIREVLEACKKSIESVAVLKNIISMFVHIGNKFGDKDLSSENYMSPRVMYNNLVKYIWVSAFTMGYGTGGGDKNVVINSPKKDKNGYEVETGDKAAFFDMRMSTVKHPLDLLGKYEKKVKKDIDDAIMQIARGGYAANIRTLDAAAIANFATYDAAVVHIRTNMGAANVQPLLAAIAGNTDNAVQLQLNAVFNGGGPSALKNAVYLQLKHIKDNLYHQDIFETEDKYFVLTMKAISSKVLTTVGLCNMMQKPRKVTSMITNPIRSIIGANEVEVIDGAVELYIRLPLLLEFYKKIFDNGNERFKKNKSANDDSETIAFIPEVGSVWSGLIQCVFDDSKQINNGVYSYENMRRIISEVNKIYNKYKSVDEAKLARNVVLDLVSEINKRYGVMKRQEIDEFYQTKKKYVSNMNSISTSPTDFDILNDNDDFEDSGPSSQFTEQTLNLKSSGNKTVQNDIQIVKEFRDKIHAELFSKNFQNIDNKSFSERVKFYKNEVKTTSSQKNKVDLIVKAIDDSSNIEAHNNDVYLLFHELVSYPLSLVQQTFRHNANEALKFQIRAYHTTIDSLIQTNPLIWALANKVDINRLSTLNTNNLNTQANVIREIQNCAYEINGNSLAVTAFTKLGTNIIQPLAVLNARALRASLYDLMLGNAVAPAYADLLAPNAAGLGADENARIAFRRLIVDIVNVNRLAPANPVRLQAQPGPAYMALLANAQAAAPAVAALPYAQYNAFIVAHNRVRATLTFRITARTVLFNGIVARNATVPTATALAGRVASLAQTIAASNDNDLQKNIKLQLGIINLLKPANYNNSIVSSFEESIVKIINLTDPITIKTSPISNDFDENHKFYNITLLNNFTSYTGSFSKEELITHFVSNFNNSLATIKFISSNKFIVDYSILQTSTEKCLESIKYNMSKLRNQLGNSIIISKYENCVNAIEDEFLFKFIYNQDNLLKPVYEILNLENVNTSISSLIQNSNLSVDRNVLYRIIVSNGPLIQDNTAANVFDNYFDISDIDDPNARIFKNVIGEAMKTYMSQSRLWIRSNVQGRLAAIGPPAVPAILGIGVNAVNPHILSSIHSTNLISRESGILVQFNNLISRYLDTFFDLSSKKFYTNLLSEFSKVQNTAIFSGTGLKDVFAAADAMNANQGAGGIRVPANTLIFPENDAVLAESIGFSIRAIMNRVVNKQLQSKYHAQASISEVSANMVEKYKAFLPMFISMFEKMCEQCMCIKKFLEMEDPAVVNGGNPEAIYPITPVNLHQDEEADTFPLNGGWVQGDSQCYSHFNNILNNIIESSRSIINDASSVLKEVDHSPQFFEVKDKAIKNFFSNTNKLPVMPQSILSNSHINIQVPATFPSSSTPESYAKLYYGTNAVVNNKNMSSDMNQYIWLKDFVSSYNSGVQKVNVFDSEKLVPYLESTNNLSKCLFETNVLNKICLQTVYNTGPGTLYSYVKPIVVMAAPGGVPVADHMAINTYYTNSSLSDLLSISENTNTDSGKRKIANSLIAVAAPNYDRDSARLMNIVDLNISPINPHALLREIPLINVYNYAFTFDDIVKKEISNVNVEDYSDTILNEHQSFAALLLDPYYSVNTRVSNGDYARAVGDNSTLGYIDNANVAQNTADIHYKNTNTVFIQTLKNEIPQSGNLPFKLGHPRYIKEIASKFQDVGDEVDLRLNNKFTRNLLFLSNLQRFILYKVKSEIESISSKKINNNHILNPRITSYDNANETNNNDEFSYLMI